MKGVPSRSDGTRNDDRSTTDIHNSRAEERLLAVEIGVQRVGLDVPPDLTVAVELRVVGVNGHSLVRYQVFMI